MLSSGGVGLASFAGQGEFAGSWHGCGGGGFFGLFCLVCLGGVCWGGGGRQGGSLSYKSFSFSFLIFLFYFILFYFILFYFILFFLSPVSYGIIHMLFSHLCVYVLVFTLCGWGGWYYIIVLGRWCLGIPWNPLLAWLSRD